MNKFIAAVAIFLTGIGVANAQTYEQYSMWQCTSQSKGIKGTFVRFYMITYEGAYLLFDSDRSPLGKGVLQETKTSDGASFLTGKVNDLFALSVVRKSGTELVAILVTADNSIIFNCI